MLKPFLRSARDLLLRTLPLSTAIRLEFLLYHRRLPHLAHPATFNEKMARAKLRDRHPLMPRLADKVLAKEYIAEALGPEWIIPTLWAGRQLPPREQRNWTPPYVIKANHGSAMCYLVLSAQDQDWDVIEKTAQSWLSTTFGKNTLEWLYAEIEPQLLVEPFIGTGKVAPADYKLFVFGGRTAFIQVDTGRLQTHRQYFYDLEWKRLPFEYVCPGGKDDVPPPQSLPRMIQAADKLGSLFPFVRADFYEVGGSPFFGELTFYPNAARIAFKPASVERQIGQLWPAQ
jgi:hypothetical protein